MPENNKMGLSALVRKSKKRGLWGGCNRFCMPEAALSMPVDDKQYVMIVAGVSGVDPLGSMGGGAVKGARKVAGVSGVDPLGSVEGAFKGVHKGCGSFGS